MGRPFLPLCGATPQLVWSAAGAQIIPGCTVGNNRDLTVGLRNVHSNSQQSKGSSNGVVANISGLVVYHFLKEHIALLKEHISYSSSYPFFVPREVSAFLCLLTFTTSSVTIIHVL